MRHVHIMTSQGDSRPENNYRRKPQYQSVHHDTLSWSFFYAAYILVWSPLWPVETSMDSLENYYMPVSKGLPWNGSTISERVVLHLY